MAEWEKKPGQELPVALLIYYWSSYDMTVTFVDRHHDCYDGLEVTFGSISSWSSLTRPCDFGSQVDIGHEIDRRVERSLSSGIPIIGARRVVVRKL